MIKNYFLAAAAALCVGLGAQAQDFVMPDELYFVGNVNNWTTPNAAEGNDLIALTPTSDGIYECTFSYDPQAFGQSIEFKIFSDKTDWTDTTAYWGTFDGTMSYTPGSTLMWYYMVSGGEGWNFSVSNYTADKVHMIIDWYAKTIQLNNGEADKAPESLHLVGDFNNWDPADHTYELALSMTDQEGTHYTGTFTLPSCTFKILTGDDWDSANYGTYLTSFDLWSDRSSSFDMVPTYGNNFNCRNWTEGEITVNVDWDNKVVSFITPDQPEYSIPESLHLVGAFNNWLASNRDYTLQLDENAKGVEYVGVFDIPEYGCEFKILPGDTWDVSYGALYYGDCELWKDQPAYFMMDANNGMNFNCTNWKGGRLEVRVNWTDFNVTLNGLDQPEYEEEKKEDVLYLIGAPQGWDITSDAIKLPRMSEKDFIYGGTVEIKEGEAMFRFYTALGDWESNSLGAQYDDYPVDITVSDGFPYKGEFVWGKGSWNIPAWEGGFLNISVDMNTMAVEFSCDNSGVASTAVGGDDLRYVAGVVTAVGNNAIVVADAAGRIVKTVAGSEADLRSLPGGIYIVRSGKSVIKVRK